uniref:Uncharacterized protein n=1 Tax=Anopheles maculatus TaxID=74869 RepID=A0A182SX96_9DIPT
MSDDKRPGCFLCIIGQMGQSRVRNEFIYRHKIPHDVRAPLYREQMQNQQQSNECESGFAHCEHTEHGPEIVPGWEKDNSWRLKIISPKPIDQEPEPHFVGVVIAVLTTIILLLIVIIMFIVAKNKRTRTAAVLDALQHNLHTDSLGIDKRLNSNFKVIISCPFFSRFRLLCDQQKQRVKSCERYDKCPLMMMRFRHCFCTIY